MEQTVVTDDQVSIIEMAERLKYRFVQFIDIGNSKSAMVMEHIETYQVRFMLPNYLGNERSVDSVLRFDMLGLILSKP